MLKRRILFEAGPMLDSNKTGVGYYVSHLMTNLQDLYSDRLDFTGYYFNFLNRHGDKTSPYKTTVFYKVWLIPGKVLSVCRRFGFQPYLEVFVRKKSDVTIFTNYVALPQMRKHKTILFVYDVSFLDTPQYTQTVNLKFLKRFCPPSIRQADVIITISEFTKDRIEHYFPDIKAKIIVTPIPPLGGNVNDAGINQQLLDMGVRPEQYILYLGTIEPRKNIIALLDAYAKLDGKTRDLYSLVLAGGKGWKDEDIMKNIEKYRSQGMNIILTGYISDDDKSALYANARCFVMPSHYEGFGMPILEAMQNNIPTVVSDIPVFHEVAGDAVLYFNKDDPDDIKDVLASVLEDNDVRQELMSASEHQLSKFSWEENAKKVFNELI